MKNKKERKGLSVKTTDKKEVVHVQPEDVGVMPPKEKAEGLTLDRIEQELVKIEADRTWLERLLKTGQELEDLEDAAAKMEARQNLRDKIGRLVEQELELEKKLQDLKNKINQNEALLDPETIRVKREILRKDLNNELLKKELEEKKLKEEIDELDNRTPDKEEDYELKNFEELKEKPPPEDDTV